MKHVSWFKIIVISLFVPFFMAMPAYAEKLDNVALRPPAAQAGVTPSEVIRGFYSALLSVMKDGSQLGFNGRFDKMTAAVQRAFDIQEMTRASYGPSWVKTTPQDKDLLIKAFQNFSASNYAYQFKAYDNEVFTVVGETNGNREGDKIVETTLKSGKDTTQLNYLMRKGDGGWKIVDIFVNGTISEIATRRSEFGSVVRTGGVESLLKTLNSKSKALSES
jgi:phospholipid transport system substrate-binding protein